MIVCLCLLFRLKTGLGWWGMWFCTAVSGMTCTLASRTASVETQMFTTTGAGKGKVVCSYVGLQMTFEKCLFRNLSTCGHFIDRWCSRYKRYKAFVHLFCWSDSGITSRSSCRSSDQTGSSSFISSRRSTRPSRSLKQQRKSQPSGASVLSYDSSLFWLTTKWS